MPRPNPRKKKTTSASRKQTGPKSRRLQTVKTRLLAATLADAGRLLEVLEKGAAQATVAPPATPAAPPYGQACARLTPLDGRKLVGALKRIRRSIEGVQRILERVEGGLLQLGKGRPQPKRGVARTAPPYGQAC